MKLGKLLEGIEILELSADLEDEIAEVVYDSRKATPGTLFVAVRGYECDGHKFIKSAFDLGAICAVCEKVPECSIPYVLVVDSRRAMAAIAANQYGNPSKDMKMIGVTGTNGKTTVTTLIKQVIEDITGKKAGLIGTNKNMIGNLELPAERTTPDSFELQKLLRSMADEGCEYAVMEVSSHALYLDRVYGIQFETGIFTNLTEDHLDFHKTMDNYARAKALLLSMCRKAVINLDDTYSPTMLRAAKCPVITYSVEKNEADLVAKSITLKPGGVSFCALTTGKLEKIRLRMPGMFSVYNALAVIGTLMSVGVSISEASEALCRCAGVKGRAEIVPTDREFTILIDYAHTPDALSNILDTVKGYSKGRTVLLFGCGGDREKEKRPIMGAIAAQKADYIYVTSDNPRTEKPSDIIADILEGVRGTDTPFEVIEDRHEAIGRAIMNAKSNDVIILAGKGHETYQVIGKDKHHFDEREIAAEFLAKL